jgi:hypothetical protein
LAIDISGDRARAARRIIAFRSEAKWVTPFTFAAPPKKL